VSIFEFAIVVEAISVTLQTYSIYKMSFKNWQVLGENFELEESFNVVDYLGAGAYGMVCAVQDAHNEIVAIKKCKSIFQSRTLAKRTLREMRLLRHFNHENIVKLRKILSPRDCNNFSDIYLLFEIMDTDLAQIIRSPQVLKEQHTQYFTFQLLRGLEYLHSKNIVHRDIK
jgi:serine/threonine protein kinase